MNIWFRACVAEHSKLKRTLSRSLVVLAPMCAFLLALFIVPDLSSLAEAKGVEPGIAYIDSLLRIWCTFFLPLMLTLQAVLIAQLEHSNQKWKHLLSLPIPRIAVYVAKIANLALLLALSHAFIFVLICVFASSGYIAFSDLSEDFTYAARKLFVIMVAAWPVLTFQLMISIRLESLVASISLGIVATIFALVAGTQLGTAKAYFPWSMPIWALEGASQLWFWCSVFASLLLSAAGAGAVIRMQVR